jgi:IclR family transcriptional regulator, acetate operon repressor
MDPRGRPFPGFFSKGRPVMAAASGTQAVDRAAGLLLFVLEAPQPPTFGELQESSGLAKSTLSRLLSSLERHELIFRSDDGTVRPGGALTRFAHSRRPTDELIEVTRPFMVDLSEATGETINLAVLDSTEVEQISQIDCTYLIGGVKSGDIKVPLHASALGKVFLAYGADLPAGRLRKISTRTITSRDRLREDLERVRERGWALADSELEPGLIAVAAPVFSAGGDVVAAISISGPTLRMTREVAQAYAELLVEQAGKASALLGFEESTSEEAGNTTVVPTGGRVGAA